MKLIKKVLVMLLIVMMMINVIPVHAVTYKEYKKGDKIKVKVNDTTSLEFYVLENSGTTSDSVKAIYSGLLEGKVEYDDINVALTTLKGVWKNASNITLPTMKEIFGSSQDLSKAFEYKSPSWALSNSRYWTATTKTTTVGSGVKTLGDKILEDNTVYPDNVRSEFVDSDTGIDFSKNSFGKSIIVGGYDGVYVPKNGKGLYSTSTNTEDGKTTYYFRGAVLNNYVKFAGYYWKIMRINEDGSIRLIFNGKGELDTNKQEELYPIRDKNVVLDHARAYNNLQPGYVNYVGYMFNQNVDPPTIAELHTNERDSSIKTYLDEWYTENLQTYDKYISGESGFCNDRTYTTNEDNATYFSTIIRTEKSTPQFGCTNSTRDLFTTDTIMKGNRELTKPIGLPTVDDLMYAGGVYKSSDSYSYLYSSNYFWTMSPGEFVSGPGSASNMFVGVSGGITATHTYLYAVQNPSSTPTGNMEIVYSNTEKNVRPVINLKSTVEFSQGDGTHDNPYMINTGSNSDSSTEVEVAWTLGGSPKGTAKTEDLTETLSIKPVITISKEYVEQLGDDGTDDGQGGTGDDTDPGDGGNGDPGDGEGDEPKNPSTGDNLLVIIGSTIILGGLALYTYKKRKVNN